MFAIQCFDYDEGSAARWFDLAIGFFETKELAREHLKSIRQANQDEYDSYAYRITEVGSDAYYSQPTDKLEY